MDKATAEKLIIDQWRALPPAHRKTMEQALAFAEAMSSQISFDALGNPSSIIRAWVVRELQGGNELNKAIRSLRGGV